MLGELPGEDPLSPEALVRRCRHVIELARTLEEANR